MNLITQLAEGPLTWAAARTASIARESAHKGSLRPPRIP
jgi:hypothetical protein